MFVYILLLPLFFTQTFSSQIKHDNQHKIEIQPYIIDYENGTITRFPIPSSEVPPPNNNQVQSKDITIVIDPKNRLRARVIIPARSNQSRKIPILLYFHGGAFCIGTPFDGPDTTYLARLSAQANVVVLTLEYRLYPKYTIPAAYDDAWAALKWIAAHRAEKKPNMDPWLAQYGDLNRVFVGGDSAGGNIAHNLVVRAQRSSLPGKVTVTGLFLAMPYFLGSKRVPFEPKTITNTSNYQIWAYVCPKCNHGIDNKYINPFGPGARKIEQLGCKKLLVYTAENDDLRGRGLWYYKNVKESGWKGQAQLIEAKGQSHVFHIFKAQEQEQATTKFINDLSAFLNN